LKKIDFGCFETEVNSIGIFDNQSSRRFPRKIILGLHLSNCEKLQKEIDYRLKNFFAPEKKFMSHLIIARIKKIEDKLKFINRINKIKIPSINFKIDKFYLIKSNLSEEGAKYEIIDEYSSK